MKLSLVVLTPGKQQGQALEIKLAQFVIGRDPECQLRPASPLISKRHCAFSVRDGKAFLRDFDSTNGTFVNDQPVKGEVELKQDDKVKVGPITFGVRLEAGVPAAPPVNRPTPPPATRAEKPEVKKPEVAAAPPAKAKPKAEAVPSKWGKADDDIADMLMSLGDDDPPAGDGPAGEVPDGSTVMDLKVPTAGTDPNAPVPPSGQAPPGEAKKEPDKQQQVKAKASETANLAKSILDKYMKRPRK